MRNKNSLGIMKIGVNICSRTLLFAIGEEVQPDILRDDQSSIFH